MLPHAMAMANKDIRGPILKDNSNEKMLSQLQRNLGTFISTLSE